MSEIHNFSENSDREKVSNMYLDDLEQYSPLNTDEEKELIEVIQGGDLKASREAKKKLIESCLRLVVFVVNKYSEFLPKDLTKDDLVQEGNVGLVEAAETFNPDKEVKFVTYAYINIKSSIFNAIRRANSSTRKGGSKVKHVSPELGVKDKKVKRPEENLVQKEISKKLELYLGELDERSQKILSMLYGLRGEERTYSLAEIGKELSVSKQRINEIRDKILNKLKSDHPELEDLI
ncbi:MAG: sigma-70 family RNA polymerase sigma factor [Patescibacteria group bacterium]